MLSLRRLLCAFALLVTASAGLVVSTTPVAFAGAADDYADQAHRVTNAQRTSRGLAPLRANACLEQFAARQAAAMARKRTIYHQALLPVLRECDLALVGENVARGYPTGRAVVVDGWMRSPGHRANILRTGYRVVAVAARRGSDGTWYVAQVFGRRLL